MDHAITGNMVHLLAVMKAVKRFKKLLARKRRGFAEGLFGRESRLVAPPHSMREGGSRSTDAHDRRPMDKVLVTAGVHRDIDVGDDMKKLPLAMVKMSGQEPVEVNVGVRATRLPGETDGHFKQRLETVTHQPHEASDPSEHRKVEIDHSRTFSTDDHAKGHAHDPLTDTLFLGISTTAEEASKEQNDPLHPIVSESPPAVEENIYEQAYQDEMKRIMDRRGTDASMYLTRRVEHRDDLRSHSNVIGSANDLAGSAASKLKSLAGKGVAGGNGGGGAGGLAGLVKQAKEKKDQRAEHDSSTSSEEPPLVAPEFDGASDTPVEDKQDTSADSPLATTGDIDAQQGAMPGMPGGFPVTPGLNGSPA